MDQASRERVENFSEAYGPFEMQLNAINEKLEAVKTDRKAREYKAQQCRLYLKKLAAPGTETGDVAVQGETFFALVDRVMAGEKLVFVLKDGSKWATEG